MIKYCNLCERKVEVKRKIGVGTLILVLITGGFWLLAIPFYEKKCPICGAARFKGDRPIIDALKRVTVFLLIIVFFSIAVNLIIYY